LEARLGVTVRGVITTTLMVTRVATPIPSVPLGVLRVSLWCSHGLLCCLHASSPTSARWSYEVLVVIKYTYLLPTCPNFIQDIEDRCLLLMSSMSFVDLPF
jgi:hypothetical protein